MKDILKEHALKFFQETQKGDKEKAIMALKKKNPAYEAIQDIEERIRTLDISKK